MPKKSGMTSKKKGRVKTGPPRDKRLNTNKGESKYKK